MSELQNRMKGFTIIEVVLVLAIAGLIFLMVFIALPALQGNQRDSQRRSDLSRFTSQMANYQSNNRGKIPATQAELDDFVGPSTGTGGGYLRAGNADGFTDPNGTAYTVTLSTNRTQAPGNNQILYFVDSGCDGETVTDLAGTQSRKFAVKMLQERGGFACQAN